MFPEDYIYYNMSFNSEEFINDTLHKKFTFLYDKNAFLFAVLVNGILESDFNTDYLSKFDDFKKSKKQIDFINSYEFYEKNN